MIIPLITYTLRPRHEDTHGFGSSSLGAVRWTRCLNTSSVLRLVAYVYLLCECAHVPTSVTPRSLCRRRLCETSCQSIINASDSSYVIFKGIS